MATFDELFDAVEEPPKKDAFDELWDSAPTPAPISTGALGTRFRPSVRTNVLGGPSISPSESLLGISPEMVPSGANTRAPWLTIPASVAGKTLAGVGGYLTSPQGATETALAATPLAPVIFAKWAYDMARSGYTNVKDIVQEIGGMARDAFDKGIISANQLGPVPEGVSLQDHIQSIAEKAANAALMGAGALGAAAHVKLPTKEVAPIVPRGTEPTPKISEEVPPSGEAGKAKPSEAPVSAAVETPVTAGETPQAIAEPKPPTPVEQATSVTPPVTEGGPGTIGESEMGAAGIKEIPETGAGGEKYGVARRIVEERAKAGQITEVPPRGQGLLPEQTVAMGREIVRKDPEAGPRIMDYFESDPKHATSEEGVAVARAHGEALAAGARTIEETYGTESPQYRQAQEYLTDWDRRYARMKTSWSNQGKGMQGETDIDTGSFTGLNRAYKETNEKDIPSQHKPKAKKIAAENKSAQEQVGNAATQLNTRIREKRASDAEKAAIDAANKTVREAAIKVADAENKARVAQAQRDKDIYNIQVKNAQKALDAAKEVERKVVERATKEAQRRANDPSIAVWEKANEILDQNKGLYSFDDLRNKVAAELGMSVKKVTGIMAQDSITKRLATDLWTKQRNARRLKEQAKIWIRELDTPGYEKALRSIPNGMFGLSVFGHGLVALGTHAPIVAFQPRFWNAYVRNFGRMYGMVFSPAYYERQMQDLVRRPNYEIARRSGLQNDPFQYEEFHTTGIRNFVKRIVGEKNMEKVDKFTDAGNRGYGILKVLRQDMFDQRYDNLPPRLQKQTAVLEGIADGVNHATGVTQKQGFKGSNILFFAPRLEASRVAWLATDPFFRAGGTVLNWKHATDAQKQFAIDQFKEKGWVLGTFASLLAMNQGFLTAAGSDQKINGIPESLGGAGFDPLASDFLKFKALGADVAYGGALLTMAKLPARIGWAIAYEGKGSKFVLEDERAYKVVGSYIRSQMSPFAGTVTDLSLGRDYEERPLPEKLFGMVEQTDEVPKRLQAKGVEEPFSWPEFAATRLPIPVAEAFKEGMRGSGMNDNQVKEWMKAIGLGLAMTGTGTRITEDTRER